MLDTFTLLTFAYDLGNLKYLAREATQSNPDEKYESSDFNLALSIWLDALKRATMNVLGLILAGYNTTANILAWFMYYASKNPEVQQKIKEELKQHNITKETSLDDLNPRDQCKYIDCVINETLRMAPIGIGSLRTVIDNVTIDGVNICKGETVVSAFALMQRDPRFWKLDPKQFIPERFFGNDAPDVNHHPLAFAPFGG
ncbi:unnamed protein product [Rotaria sordida]|nr:unnamed protein product [Rotaria sordida]